MLPNARNKLKEKCRSQCIRSCRAKDVALVGVRGACGSRHPAKEPLTLTQNKLILKNSLAFEKSSSAFDVGHSDSVKGVHISIVQCA